MSEGDDSEDLSLIPGFGFLPQTMVTKAERIFEDILELHSAQERDNFNKTEKQKMMCNLVYATSWRDLYPGLSPDTPDQAVCPPMWDGASCIPLTFAGNTAILPCMDSYQGVKYSALYNASRRCEVGGIWSDQTNYLDCYCKGSLEHRNTSTCSQHLLNNEEIPNCISLIGYTLSFLALLLALSTYLTFRELRCLRHKIHIGLFSAFALSSLNWILTNSSVEELMPPELAEPLLCTTFTLTYFFHLASFYWMFCEGFYLFLQVQFPLSLVSIKYKHFLLFGLVAPVANTSIWLAARLSQEEGHNSTNQDCLFAKEEQFLDFWVMKLPMLIILFWNTIFLVWIITIVVSKLRERTALDHDRRHLKAAKALILVMTLLGFGFVITLVVRPSVEAMEVPLAIAIFRAIEAVIISSHGLVITLPFCFLNTEVQAVVRTHWRRWKMVRNVGKSSGGKLINSSCRTSSHIVEPHPKLLLDSVEPHPKLLLDSANLEPHRTSSPDLLALSGGQHYYNHKLPV